MPHSNTPPRMICPPSQYPIKADNTAYTPYEESNDYYRSFVLVPPHARNTLNPPKEYVRSLLPRAIKFKEKVDNNSVQESQNNSNNVETRGRCC